MRKTSGMIAGALIAALVLCLPSGRAHAATTPAICANTAVPCTSWRLMLPAYVGTVHLIVNAYDGDSPNEGTMTVNPGHVVPLFGPQGTPAYGDGKIANFDYYLVGTWFQVGTNVLSNRFTNDPGNRTKHEVLSITAVTTDPPLVDAWLGPKFAGRPARAATATSPAVQAKFLWGSVNPFLHQQLTFAVAYTPGQRLRLQSCGQEIEAGRVCNPVDFTGTPRIPTDACDAAILWGTPRPAGCP